MDLILSILFYTTIFLFILEYEFALFLCVHILYYYFTIYILEHKYQASKHIKYMVIVLLKLQKINSIVLVIVLITVAITLGISTFIDDPFTLGDNYNKKESR